MANLPISGLTAATTPLAGTEVLPIVQGGVTVKVSVANLTAGRDVSVLTANATSTTDSTTTATGAIVTAGGVGIAKALFVGTVINAVAGTAAAPSVKVGSTQSGLCEDTNTRLAIVSGGKVLIECATVGASSNYIAVSANNTPNFTAQGPGTDIDLTLSAKGANDVGIQVGSLRVLTVGKGLKVAEGSNAKQGTATLIGGASVVSNTSVTATSRIFLTSNADGGTPGWLRVSARSVGTSFTITSSSGTDTSTVAYEIFEVG